MEKEKIQDLIDKQRTNLADVDYLDLDSVSKIVKDFNNPKLPEGYDINTDNSFRITEQQDSEYMQAAEAGDLEKAQRMVNEAAKEWGAMTDKAGNPMVVYHGTPWYGFNEFESGGSNRPIYFAENQKFADSFAKKHRGEEDYFEELGKPLHEGVYGVFLNMKNPTDLGDLGTMGEKEAERVGNHLGLSLDQMSSFGGITDFVGYEILDSSPEFNKRIKELGYVGIVCGVRRVPFFTRRPSAATVGVKNKPFFTRNEVGIVCGVRRVPFFTRRKVGSACGVRRRPFFTRYKICSACGVRRRLFFTRRPSAASVGVKNMPFFTRNKVGTACDLSPGMAPEPPAGLPAENLRICLMIMGYIQKK